MKRITIIIFICLLLINSCTTSNEKIVLESIPSWVTNDIDNELIESEKNYYKIEGTGFSIYSATLNAVNNFYNEISTKLNISDKQTFITELSENYYYEPFEFKIEKKYINQNEDNSYNIIYLVSANKVKVEEGKETKIENDITIQNELVKLEEESNSLYRENNDYESIKTLIAAYISAKENGFDNKADTYLKTIVSRISSLKIRVYAKNNKNSLEIRINREQGLMNPLVEGATLIAQYNSKDINFKNYLSKESLLPFKNNTFIFYLDDKNLNLKGLVIFKIDLEDEINVLRKMNYGEAVNQIEKAINERVFAYIGVSDFKDKKIIISTIENDINQERRESVTADFFSSKLEELEADVVLDLGVDIENIDDFSSRADYLFMFRAEIVERVDGIRPFVSSHGSLEIYDLSNLSLVYDSGLIDSIAIKDTMEESEKESLINVAKRAYHNYL